MVLSLGYPKTIPSNVPKLKKDFLIHKEIYTEHKEDDIKKAFEEKYGSFEENLDKSMVGYFSVSQKSARKIGLVWLEFPRKAEGSFVVHLRKESDKGYPKKLIERAPQYKANGWGGYPQLIVTDKASADTAIELINFAYERF